ncbi:MAG TPA: hypothetical protein VFT61_00660 [Sphingomicrobium sp.]|nr:hypothetical protein [Sphingomicrobium sp.]
MSIEFGEIAEPLTGFFLPYAIFLTFRPPFNLKIDATGTNRLEQWSLRWLKRILAASGAVMAGASYLDRHANDGFTFGLALSGSFALWLLAVPAGKVALYRAYGWDKKIRKRRSGQKSTRS